MRPRKRKPSKTSPFKRPNKKEEKRAKVLLLQVEKTVKLAGTKTRKLELQRKGKGEELADQKEAEVSESLSQTYCNPKGSRWRGPESVCAFTKQGLCKKETAASYPRLPYCETERAQSAFSAEDDENEDDNIERLDDDSVGRGRGQKAQRRERHHHGYCLQVSTDAVETIKSSIWFGSVPDKKKLGCKYKHACPRFVATSRTKEDGQGPRGD